MRSTIVYILERDTYAFLHQNLGGFKSQKNVNP
jgi:hypothetical protein